MNKIPLIIEREYMSRVKKKSFIIMSILGPILIAALYIIPIVLATMDTSQVRKIAVIDTTGELKEALKSDKTITYDFLDKKDINEAKKALLTSDYYALLYRSEKKKYDEKGLVLISEKQPSIDIKLSISNAIEDNIERYKMQKLNITQAALDSLKTNVALETLKLTEEGTEEESSTELAMAISFMAALFIYFVIFLYGSQVMRGVIEEKNNRIVEVIISSVRPFQLMMGKILGVALVVLTQLLLWFVLSFLIISAAGFILPEISPENAQMIAESNNVSGIKNPSTVMTLDNLLGKFFNLNLPLLLFCFVFYLIGGYLTYAALFAAVGSAVDNETDSQQFMLPVSLPMILAFVVAMNIIREPEGTLAFWMSIIPFTSPITMMVRIPFGVSTWELMLSITLLIGAFIGTTWVAAKIYRTGILMYGKKPTYKELWKWIRYKS